MGDYTPTQDFYLINGDELVNVENDLNYNLKRADDRMKPLIQYYVCNNDVSNITTDPDIPKDVGFKFYKPWSNSVWVWATAQGDTNPSMLQDLNSRVETWVTTGITFETGWVNGTGSDAVGYMTSNGWAYWRGNIKYTPGIIPSNTVMDICSIPAGMVPNVDRFFFISGGPGVDDWQLFRVMVAGTPTTPKKLQIFKYCG